MPAYYEYPEHQYDIPETAFDINGNLRRTSLITVESWNKNRFSRYEDDVPLTHKVVKQKKKSNWSRHMFFLSGSLLCIIICIGIFGFKKLKTDLKDLKKEIKEVEQKLNQYNDTMQNNDSVIHSAGTKDTLFTGITLCGKDHERIKTNANEPLNNWKVKVKNGDIEYDETNGHVKIMRTGMYYVYAQMYGFENKNESNEIEFHINKDYHSLAMSVVPKEACKSYCTKFISKVARLKKGEHIYVASHRNDCRFYMACDKAMFGMYMIHSG